MPDSERPAAFRDRWRYSGTEPRCPARDPQRSVTHHVAVDQNLHLVHRRAQLRVDGPSPNQQFAGRCDCLESVRRRIGLSPTSRTAAPCWWLATVMVNCLSSVADSPWRIVAMAVTVCVPDSPLRRGRIGERPAAVQIVGIFGVADPDPRTRDAQGGISRHRSIDQNLDLGNGRAQQRVDGPAPNVQIVRLSYSSRARPLVKGPVDAAKRIRAAAP